MALLTVGLWLCGEQMAFGQDNGQALGVLKPQRNREAQLPAKFQLTRSVFAPHLSEMFLVRLNGEEVYLQLVEVGDLEPASIDKSALHNVENPAFKVKLQEESFRLLFRAVSENRLRQNTWRLEHRTLGDVELFLVPVGRPDGPYQLYEAVFNRLQR